MADYREEVLNITNFKLEDCERLVSAFNETFSSKDAYMSIEGEAIHLMLAQLDVKKVQGISRRTFC